MVRKMRKSKINKRITKRSESNRNSSARVLIVGEGLTEERYFEAVAKEYGLQKKYITITASSEGPLPLEVAESVKNEIENAINRNSPYDHVFCVFDMDVETGLKNACQEILDTCNDMENKKDVLALSYPCFEYWVLLHFEYKRPVFTKKSPCVDCTDKLKKRIKNEKNLPNYKKNYNGFGMFMDKLEIAIKNSKKSCREASNDITGNPTSTEVYKVLECLKELKKTNRVRSA